jgi:transcriptional regulator with XRE-family HTH domain
MAAGLSQEQLAFRAKIARNYVSLLELNQKSPTVTVLFRLCKALDIRASVLLARVERKTPR